ncbi:MAG: hypothetical protein F6K50_08220 [Moorea sp. SIO3I7]|uniref:hypothetical protein n=1 Tax=Moorena sp. SIO3I8 TaxID=2607833 RepID=UPI0013BF3C15|nr:hypothetical protein [Moorena sp. SIO3I8]NEN95509.1 hypothetical protein [Moorena sp. SIO3I7]NEO04573.1 hypothetical protein [Moorena sp. SIO3I8]
MGWLNSLIGLGIISNVTVAASQPSNQLAVQQLPVTNEEELMVTDNRLLTTEKKRSLVTEKTGHCSQAPQNKFGCYGYG